MVARMQNKEPASRDHSMAERAYFLNLHLVVVSYLRRPSSFDFLFFDSHSMMSEFSVLSMRFPVSCLFCQRLSVTLWARFSAVNL